MHLVMLTAYNTYTSSIYVSHTYVFFLNETQGHGTWDAHIYSWWDLKPIMLPPRDKYVQRYITQDMKIWY